MIDRLLGRSKEPIELEPDEALEEFQRRKSAELEKAEKRAEKIRSEISDAMDELDTTLEQLEGYEDSKGRTIVEDVMDNIVRDRRKMIDRVSLPREPGDIQSELEQFLEDFQAMKQKEVAVMEEVKKQDMIASKLGDLKKYRDRLSSLLENEYQVKLMGRDLEETLDTREELLEEMEEIEQELRGLDEEELREEKRDLQQELEEHRQGEAWQEYDDLKEELEDARKKKRRVRQQLGKSAGKMERGLKKLLYQARNGDLSLAADKGILEDIQQKDIDNILDYRPSKVEEAVEKAADALPDELLDESQREKFLSGSETFRSMAEKVEELRSLEESIEALEEELEGHDVLEKEEELERKINRLQDRIEAEKERRQELEQRKQETESELEQLEEKIRRILATSLDREVNLEN